MRRRVPSFMPGSNQPHSTKESISSLRQGANGFEADKQLPNDNLNYALLIALYTLQGIPLGLSASIPFLIQQKIKLLSTAASAAAASASSAATTAAAAGTSSAAIAASASRLSYNANAIFALCSWPFSLKLLWAPIVDSVFIKGIGRRKSWLVPVQLVAGIIMIVGSDFVENQLGLGSLDASSPTESFDALQSMNVKGVTIFFFVLYFLMATQDIAVDGWALTMLSKPNRGKGPVCNSIGQNIGYFMSFVGFLALNDAESSETLWRPLLRLKSRPGEGLVSLGAFIRFMGGFMVVVTTFVAIFKSENDSTPPPKKKGIKMDTDDNDDDDELDASEIGLKETYRRLWAVCQLPPVKWLFLILLTFRLPVALGDNVKFLKAVEYGMSKSTTALLSPTLILPLGILVPIVAAKFWYGHPLRQFMTAYKIRVFLSPILDVLMLTSVKNSKTVSKGMYWMAVIASTGMQAAVSSLQFNAQMMFFASRVDPAIGGSYMTLLNTAANLGGTWPSSVVMYLVGALTVPPTCETNSADGVEVCSGGRDAYVPLQIGLSLLGCLWILALGSKVQNLAEIPNEAWRTSVLTDDGSDGKADEEKANNKESKRE